MMMKGKSSREMRDEELNELRRKNLTKAWHEQNPIDPNSSLSIRTIDEWQYQMRHRGEEERQKLKTAEEYLRKYKGTNVQPMTRERRNNASPQPPSAPLSYSKQNQHENVGVSVEKLKDQFDKDTEIVNEDPTPSIEVSTPEIIQNDPVPQTTFSELNFSFCFRLLTKHTCTASNRDELTQPYMKNAHSIIETSLLPHQDSIHCNSSPIVSFIQPDESSSNKCLCYIVTCNVCITFDENSCSMSKNTIQELVLDGLKTAVMDGSFARV